jgi:hypothetical protein
MLRALQTNPYRPVWRELSIASFSPNGHGDIVAH